jgi:hypothetical protein
MTTIEPSSRYEADERPGDLDARPTPQSSVATPPDEAADHRSRPRGAGLLVPLALMIVAILLVGLHVRAYRPLSPIDELQHIDYALKVSHGELVRYGDKFGEQAMREEACRRVDSAFSPPSCTAPVLHPEDFQEAGYNTAYAHPPGFYAVDGLGGRLLDLMPGVNSAVTGIRLMGALWLGGGLVLLWFALAELGARPLARVPILALVACAPAVLHATATINPDGTGLAIGAAALLVVLRWDAGRASPWWLVAVGTAAMLTKFTNLMGVGAAAIFILVRWFQARRRDSAVAAGDGNDPGSDSGPAPNSTRRTIVALGALIAAVGVAGIGWTGVSAAAAAPNTDEIEIPMAQAFKADAISVDQVVGNVPAALSPLHNPYVPAVLSTTEVGLAAILTDRLLLAGGFAALLMSAAASRQRALAGAGLAAMVIVGPFFVVADFAFAESYFAIPARYGLSVVPFVAAAAALAYDRSLPGRVILWAAAALGAVAMAVALVS